MNYQMTSLEKYISELYKNIGITKPHQIDIKVITSKLGIELTYSKYESQYIDCLQVTTINLQVNKTIKEQWEDFAHELAHSLLHFGNQMLLPKTFREKQEWQANNFALHFCVPTFMLLEFELPQFRNQAIGFISKKFGVTLEFAEKRLEHYENQVYGEMFRRSIINESGVYEEKYLGSIDLHDDLPLIEQPSFKKYINDLRDMGVPEDVLESIRENANYRDKQTPS